MSFSPSVFWWHIWQSREFLQGLKQYTAGAGSGARSRGTIGKAVSRQPLLPLDEGRKAAANHHSSQPLPEKPAWDAASLRPCPQRSSNNDRSKKTPLKSEQPLSPDRQLSFHLTPTLEAEKVQQSPAASAQPVASGNIQEAAAEEDYHSLSAGQGLTGMHSSEGAQPLSPCLRSPCVPHHNRPEAGQATPTEQPAAPAAAKSESHPQMAGISTAASLSPSPTARDLPATEVQECPNAAAHAAVHHIRCQTRCGKRGLPSTAPGATASGGASPECRRQCHALRSTGG